MTRRFHTKLVWLYLAFFALLAACSPCSSTPEEDVEPWRFSSEDDAFELVFPGTWHPEPTGSINPHAVIEAHREDTLFFMVIPQQMPTFPNPDVFDLKRAALAMLDDSLEDFVIERQGPFSLDGVSGLTVYARGTVDGQKVSYINSYIIHQGIGYQIVAFTDATEKDLLFEEVDRILSTWSFLKPQTAPVEIAEEIEAEPAAYDEASDDPTDEVATDSPTTSD